MVSIIKVTSVQDTSGNNETTTENIKKSFDGAAKAWANLESGSASILDSLNIASTTDNGTGDHTITYSNALANDDYSVSGSSQTARRYFSGYSAATKLTSSMRFVIYVDNGTINDTDSSVQAFGDLA